MNRMERILAWMLPHWNRLYARTSPLVDRIVTFIGDPKSEKDAEFDAHDNWTAHEGSPRGVRLTVWFSFLALITGLVWAAFAELDEVTRGEGKVIPSRQIQVLQSLDGGIVSEILVKEGQAVKAGELLLRVDSTRMVSSLRENRVQYLALLAKAARLKALSDGGRFAPPEEALREAPDIVTQERLLYESRRSELDATLAVARQQSSQRAQELIAAKARREQASQSYTLTARELELTRPLVKTGAVSDVELLRLERDLARYRGERDSANTDIPRLESSVIEANRRAQELELTFRNAARTELSETNAKLNTLSEGSTALEDRVNQTEIRSPLNGTVKQLKVNTVGGVVQPGKDVIELVPADDALLLEARIQPKDIAFLRPGQPALIKFTAYDYSIYGGLEATLEHISADSVLDEKGNAYYLVRLRTASTSIGPQRLPIIPGMIAEVDILTGKKSVLAYLLKPISRAKARALTER
ncbi:MAG: HlyD family type I secretion periplasmic adaptor subunit [Rhodoferax sp.]|nr:MAG: HlyD family type I secretion periplasmic adaptor subunit [Rhodoferax sp.]